jgi:hypothetical protein
MSTEIDELYELIDLYFNYIKSGDYESSKNVDRIFNEKMNASFDELDVSEVDEIKSTIKNIL